MTVKPLPGTRISCMEKGGDGRGRLVAGMPDRTDQGDGASEPSGLSFGRLVPVAVIVAVMAATFATGWHRQLSLETLIRHRAILDAFVSEHWIQAQAAYLGLYVAAVALSIPGAALLTIAGGILFGAWIGAALAIVGATFGASLVFLAASGAFHDVFGRRAGALAGKLAAGFRANAFSYLLFLRLAPLFPFWLVNIVPALVGVSLSTFVAATAIGIIPATAVFAFVGEGFDSALSAKTAVFRDCMASGGADCRFDFDLGAAFTPQLIAALVGLGLLALLPVLIKWLRGRNSSIVAK